MSRCTEILERCLTAALTALTISIALVGALAFLAGCQQRPGWTFIGKGEVDNTAGTTEASVPLGPRENVIVVPPGARFEWDVTTSQQPSPSKGPATASRDYDEDTAGAGSGDAPEASQVLADMWWLQVVGVVLLLAGAAIFLAKRAGPTAGWAGLAVRSLPAHFGKICAAIGAALIVLPYFLEAHGGLLLGIALGVVALWALRWARNATKAATPAGGPWP